MVLERVTQAEVQKMINRNTYGQQITHEGQICADKEMIISY